jgi:prepilin-type N-terminal cleavage/methylation domain-containing protein
MVKKNLGFTLVELMIVMAIVALLLTLVGPLAINNLEKAQAKQEMLSVKNWLRKLSYQSFLTGKKIKLKVEGKQMELELANENASYKNLDVLSFELQKFTFNESGYVHPTSIKGNYRGKPIIVDLASWINGNEAITTF